MEDQETLVRLGEEAELLLDSEAFRHNQPLVDASFNILEHSTARVREREVAYTIPCPG